MGDGTLLWTHNVAVDGVPGGNDELWSADGVWLDEARNFDYYAYPFRDNADLVMFAGLADGVGGREMAASCTS